MEPRTIKAHPGGSFASPWVVIGSALVLVVVVLVLAVMNHRRETRYMFDFLKEKGSVYIKSFEAGARTGSRGQLGEGAEVQALVEELSQSPDVNFLAITDRHGRILAHSDPSRIGQDHVNERTLRRLRPKPEEQWRVVRTGGQKSFEVYQRFKPVVERRFPGSRRGRPEGRLEGRRDPECAGRMWWRKGPSRNGVETEAVIFVGLSMSALEQARRRDALSAALLMAVLIFSGFGGVMSLFWAHNYRVSRRLMLDARAMAGQMVLNLPIGLIVIDPQGQVAFVNEAARKIMDRSSRDLAGRPADEVLPSGFHLLFERLDRAETILDEEMEVSFSPLGPATPLSLTAANVVTEEGTFVGRLVIFRDLGEIRQLQAEVARSERLAALGSLAAGVAHEIRNPLSSIKGFATFFSTRFPDGSPERQAAQTMVREVERLNRVITELLEFARPSSLKVQSVDLKKILDHSLNLIQPDVAARNIRLVADYGDAPLPAFLDPDRVSQALLNLYLNSIQAMESGGTLTVRARSDAQGRLSVEVADTGPGIPPQDLKQVFNPYFTTKPQGTGLGLAVVHKIVTAHGGSIKAVSHPGQGTVFTLLFPHIQTETGKGSPS